MNVTNKTFLEPEKNSELLKKEYEESVTRVKSFPSEIILATTTRCNMNPPCVMCDRNIRPISSERDCPKKIISSLKPALSRAETLYLHCSGEPLVYQNLRELLRMINPPTKIRFNTNGLLLEEDLIKEFVDTAKIDAINFSLDAATESTYRKIRRNGFNKVIQNIKKLAEYKRLSHRQKPDIQINMCIMKANLTELLPFVKLAGELNASTIELFHLNHGRDWTIQKENGFIFNYKEQEIMDPNLHDEILIKAHEECNKLKINLLFMGSMFLSDKDKQKKDLIRTKIAETEKDGYHECISPWSRAVISTDGTVRICFFHDEINENIGNLYEQSFKDIWQGNKAVKVREEFLRSGHSVFCKKENTCMFMGRK